MAKLPKMTREEEAEFWKTHSSADYWDDMEDVELKVHPRIKSPRNLSPRCPVCDEVLLTCYVDLDVAHGRLTLHKVHQLYCPKGHVTKLAPQAEKIVKAIEAVLELQPEAELQVA
jgi:hypothetical protein